jgi:hypothetical protein
MSIVNDWQRAELTFVSSDQYAMAIERLCKNGARTFLMQPNDPILAARLNERFGPAINLFQVPPRDLTVDAVLIPPVAPSRLDAELFSYLDRPTVIVAPITANYIGNRSLFVVTIPKSGTHLLFHLLESFRVRPAGRYDGVLEPCSYYFLFHDHSHLPAEDFVELLSHTPRGGAGHPFFSLPMLFTYRNPLDILVSEVFYYVNRERTALAHFYQDMTPAELGVELIRGEPLLPSLRKRVFRHSPWLRLKNVIPLSYEELVGSRGDGSDEATARAVWSLQLKLHVPGSPLAHVGRAYTEASATFRKGRINSHREFFGPEHYEEFRRLPQDFMHTFGYDVDDRFEDGYLPRFVDAFRQRPLQMAPVPRT